MLRGAVARWQGSDRERVRQRGQVSREERVLFAFSIGADVHFTSVHTIYENRTWSARSPCGQRFSVPPALPRAGPWPPLPTRRQTRILRCSAVAAGAPTVPWERWPCQPQGLSLLSQTSPPARGPVRCYLFLSCFREEIETLTKKFQELEETKKEEEGGPVEVTPEVRLRLLGRGWDAVTLMAPTPGVSRRAHGRFRFLLSSAAFCKLRVLNPKSWANGVCG